MLGMSHVFMAFILGVVVGAALLFIYGKDYLPV